MSGPSGRGGRVLFGWVLITGGALMVVLCGSCSGWVLWNTLPLMLSPARAAYDPSSAAQAPLVLFVVMLLGVVPTLIGGALLVVGLRRRGTLQPLVFGQLLIGLGALIALISGGWTLVMLIELIGSAQSLGSSLPWLVILLVLPASPVVLGLVILLSGVRAVTQRT